MLAVLRFVVPMEEGERFADAAREALSALGACVGCLGGTLGRAVDDPTAWVLETRWRSVGAYRRALSSYDVKLRAVPLLSMAVDEPSAFESLAVLEADGVQQHPPARAEDADTVNLGEAAGPGTGSAPGVSGR